jgi:hypothetical protein
MGVLGVSAVEVGFAFAALVGVEIAIPALQRHTAADCLGSFAASHLGALLFQDGLA